MYYKMDNFSYEDSIFELNGELGVVGVSNQIYPYLTISPGVELIPMPMFPELYSLFQLVLCYWLLNIWYCKSNTSWNYTLRNIALKHHHLQYKDLWFWQKFCHPILNQLKLIYKMLADSVDKNVHNFISFKIPVFTKYDYISNTLKLF